MLRSPQGEHHLTNNTGTSDLCKVAGIVIVDFPTWFDHEQEKSNASPRYRCERDKKYFHHDGMLPKCIQERFTPPYTDDGKNGYPRLRLGDQHWAGWEGASGPLMAARK